MITKNKGQSLLEFMLIGPVLTLAIFLTMAFLYYFMYQIASQYHSYQAMLCAITQDAEKCEIKLKQKLLSFKGFQQEKLQIKTKESAKSIKVKISWQDEFVLVRGNVRRENSVYLPKKI